jgi:integrase
VRRAPKYIHAFVDRHGKSRFYFRREGSRSTALPGLPWSPEFMAAYESALKGDPSVSEIGASRTKIGTVNAVIVAYYSDLAFTSLGKGTQKARRNILESFRVQHGDKRFSQLTQAALSKILGSKKPQAARSWRKTLRGLIKFAVARHYIPEDVTQGIEFPKVRSDGIHTWTEDEILQFENKYPIGTRPRLAFALLLYTGQRKSDVLRMGRQHIREGAIFVRQQKTGTQLEIPIHRALQPIIDGTPAEHLTFLTTESGKPFSPAGFGNLFRDWCNAADLPSHCSAHGLRKAACRRLAEADCTDKQIAAVSGHSSPTEVARYTKAASQKLLARVAIAKVEGTQN